LEEWIEEQQTNLAEQVKQINSAYEKNKSTLESTGSFTAEEIEKQL
jgi:NTP pyrophosphatase (non-canonical NTP hydrolase)